MSPLMFIFFLFPQQVPSHHWEPILTPAENGLLCPVFSSLHHGAKDLSDSQQKVLEDTIINVLVSETRQGLLLQGPFQQV